MGIMLSQLLTLKPLVGFVASQKQAAGTCSVPWRQTVSTDCPGGSLCSITAMPEYACKSFEELRWEDYQVCFHGYVCLVQDRISK